MRKYKKVFKTIENEVLVETTCDLCGTFAKDGDWQSSIYEVNEVEVKVTVRKKDGSIYPEGGWGTSYNVDMCPDCFENKLIPWLESQGCKTEREEWGW